MSGLACAALTLLAVLVIGAMWWTDLHIDPYDPDDDDMDRHSW